MKNSTIWKILALLVVLTLCGLWALHLPKKLIHQVTVISQSFTSPEKESVKDGQDRIMREIEAYRMETRTLYNNQRFADLESRAKDLHTSKAKFGNGIWKITLFYNCLECREEEPESMWQLHEQIHKNWVSQYPNSITARVAQADFFVSYAWHARGADYANKVTQQGWRLFRERLAEARKILDQAKDLSEKCPEWWRVCMTLARGQSWSREDFNQLFEEAKAFEPTFQMYDISRACYLLPRWHGKPGEWEAAAEKEIDRPGGLGLEGYAVVAFNMRSYYQDLFHETRLSWEKVRQGMEIRHQHYPDSAEILNHYCCLACYADDKELASKLFAEIGDRLIPHCWGGTQNLARMKEWAGVAPDDKPTTGR